MDLEIAGAYIYFTIPVFGGIPVTQTMLSQLIVTIVLCWAFVFLGKDLRKDKPSGRQVMVEKGVSLIQSLVAESMGPQNVHWTPFVATIFLSSLLGSYIGLTGFLRSTTADLSCVIVWAVMVSVIIWYNNIKHNGFLGWLKGFTEPIAVMTPMNIVSEIAQPVSMAFRHFGNVAGGGVISALLYAALTLASTALLNLITASGWAVSGVLVAAGILLLVAWLRKRKKAPLIFGILSLVLGLCGLLQATGLLVGIPILTYGIPALLSCYFDIFSGFIQAYVFTLLTVIYIAGSLPNSGE
jgi:F-type H+-transporting ATPase subunit a